MGKELIGAGVDGGRQRGEAGGRARRRHGARREAAAAERGARRRAATGRGGRPWAPGPHGGRRRQVPRGNAGEDGGGVRRAEMIFRVSEVGGDPKIGGCLNRHRGS